MTRIFCQWAATSRYSPEIVEKNKSNDPRDVRSYVIARISERRKRGRTGCEKTAGTEIKHYMPGIKRNYPRYTSIISFIEFRRQPQRAKSRQRKGKKRAGMTGDGNSLNLHSPLYQYIGVYVYILLRYSYRLQRRLRQTTSLNILRYDRPAHSLRQARKEPRE